MGNGDGSFQPAVGYDVGTSSSTAVAIADVNGDTKPDLVIANQGGKVSILLNNGDGTFAPAALYDARISAYSMAVAELNHDGKLDVVVSGSAIYNNFGHTLGTLLGNGDGTFQQALTYDAGAPSGGWANSVAVGDLNGDGNPDLVTANYPDSMTGVLMGSGDGSFQTVVLYSSAGQFAWSEAIADVNGDGKQDLIVANFNGPLSVLLGNGDGTFQPAIPYSVQGAATSVTATDVNGDGRPDLLVTNGNYFVSVMLNNSGATTPIALISSLNPSVYGQKVTFTAMVTGSGTGIPTGKVAFTWSRFTIGTAILDSNGIATLTKKNLNADPYPLIAVYKGDANNSSSASPILNQVVVQTTSAATITSSLNPSTFGQPVTFTAKITSPTVIPTGPVTFASGKTVLGTAQLSGGKASLSISSLPVGSTRVTVTYYGNSNIAKSSASLTQTVR